MGPPNCQAPLNIKGTLMGRFNLGAPKIPAFYFSFNFGVLVNSGPSRKEDQIRGFFFSFG